MTNLFAAGVLMSLAADTVHDGEPARQSRPGGNHRLDPGQGGDCEGEDDGEEPG
jgi:hypothetical protein